MKHTDKFLTLGSAAAVSALLLTGCGQQDEDAVREAPEQTSDVTPENQSTAEITDDPSDGKAGVATDTATASPSDQNGGQIASVAAVKTALEKYDDAAVVEMEYDRDRDEYQVEVLDQDTDRNVVVDGSGQNVTADTEDGQADAEDVERMGQTSVPAQEALQRGFKEASAQGGDPVLDEISLDEENRAMQWKTTFKEGERDLAYTVDGTSGSVDASL